MNGFFSFRYLYDLEQSIEEKIEIIAKEVYGASGIEISPTAQAQIDRYKAQVWWQWTTEDN